MPGTKMSVRERLVYDKWMQFPEVEQLTSESVVKRCGHRAGGSVRFASVCVARHHQTNSTGELSSDSGNAIQRFAGVESFDGQFGQIYLSAVVIGGDGWWGHYKDVAKDEHQPHLDPDDFSCDLLHFSIVGRG